ncbi:uncharacterized protein BJ212DRAFT_997875 [Suillus subaureus]|uniref:Fungal-type protein kinase domain-containing protein n=1 Tax=Suillus subaureus TaxID=48587 RepID=A0A9P7J4K0_9AGAM|nr:uncharacterized protein BJ212DRAFT_997875 [Suillus subaureus]KAG1802515.1 hypothetical protein BJ212DRAFT_997875 [Suillus subaureus]
MATPHTPRSQRSQILPPDVVPFTHHISQTDYRTGDLKLGRIAVLADLGSYLQVPFDCLVKCVGAMPSQQDLQRIRNSLTNKESKILTDDESGLRWTDFTPPAKSKGPEENMFQPLGLIISEILAEVPDCGVSFLANPKEHPSRSATILPGLMDTLYLAIKKLSPRCIGLTSLCHSSSRRNGILSLRDDEQKIIWSLHSIMREDPCRRFTFGITIEDTQLRLWLSNRAFLAVTEPINFFENIDGVISLFYVLGSASSTMKELGWDPTVERVRDGKEIQYKFTIGNEVFTTTRELATYGADFMVGRGTRVYEATDAKGKKVAIKDSWREVERQSDGEILENILASCAEKLQAEELADAKRHFVGVRLWKDVTIDDTPDETLDPLVGEEHNCTWEWVSFNLNPILFARPHLPSTGNVPDSGRLSAFLPTQLGSIARSDTGIPRRVHTRTVFHDVGVAVKDVTSLADNLSCLSGGLKALYYMHKAGWVHRDFSVGNVIWVVDNNGSIGKLGDFEYAKKIDSNISHDVRTGTIHFMAVEVEREKYLFRPTTSNLRPLGRDPHDTSLPLGPPFRMNFLHDIESVWWAFTWIFFYHTDTDAADVNHPFNVHAQWEQFWLAFPGTVGQLRWEFFVFGDELQTTCDKVLSETCCRVCDCIPHFAGTLQDAYRKAEANYPLLALDDTLLKDMHRQAAGYLDRAQQHAGGIELCPLPNLLKQKRPRPGEETSPPPKKPRHG